ncbi:hypothetical protein [Nocardia sp. R6R-6]|uniref:hypothetical protein n=1 Tax=Nocardia sp. R6R-6 TaxID=3459303 RepID=UPI00403DFDEB
MSTAPSTSSAIMFGIWLATVNALAMAGPSTVSSSSCLPNPVIRLISVANAIDPESLSSRELALCFESSAFGGCAVLVAAGHSLVLGRSGPGGSCRTGTGGR